MDQTNPVSTLKPTFIRAFRPLWVTLGLSVIVLAADYHVRHIDSVRLKVEVTVEGALPESGFIVEVNGRRLGLDDPAPLGHR